MKTCQALHQLSLQQRPLLYRAALSEMIVPYGDNDNMHAWKHVLDASEYNMGMLVNSLKLGCDCLGEIFYFDVNQVTWEGKVKCVENAICMHEEDYGILWKHTDPYTQRSEVRRSRRLVVSSFFTIGNYDYGIFWYLYLDGTIEFEAKLTGTLYLRAILEGEETSYGSLVAPGVSGMVHEHYFNVRLDMSVDGDSNTVVEMQADRIPMGPNNPHGNAHGVSQTVIKSEQEGARDTAPKDSRFWKIENRDCSNRLGWHPAYKLMPVSYTHLTLPTKA